MSVRQIDFQLLIVRKRLHMCALDIEQTFGDTAITGDVATDDQVREAVKKARVNAGMQVEFATLMDQRQPESKALMGQGVTVATRLFHHSELAGGAQIGRVSTDATLWQRVFQEMVRTVYVHPGMYSRGADGYALSKSLEVIESMLDLLLYAQVPLVFSAVPVSDVVPLTQSNLASTTRDVRRNVRVAPSVVSVASTAVAEDDADEEPASKSRVADVSASQLTEEDARSIVSQRRQRAPSPVGSVLTAYTRPGMLSIQIPETTRGRRK